MKTVIVTSFHPLISRNILSTDIISKLISSGIRVVVLCPLKKVEFFTAEFQSRGVEISAIDTAPSWYDSFLRILAISGLNTQTLKIKRKTEMKGRGAVLSLFLSGKIGCLVVRKLSNFLTRTMRFKEIFSKYSPDLIFSTDVQNEFDVELMVVAQKKGIKVVSMVRSWDNLTSKGLVRHIPDVLLVESEITKVEAITLHGIPDQKIEVVGVPHYDSYIANNLTVDQAKKNLDIGSNKVIFYGPTGDRYVTENNVDKDIFEFMKKNIPNDSSLWVRLPPTDTVSFIDENVKGDNFFVDRPVKTFKTLKNNELDTTDDLRLQWILKATDVAVIGPSTLAVDFVVFDKPIILIAFDGCDSRSYLKSIKRYYDYNHFQKYLSNGGVRIVYNEKELSVAISDYLQNPSLDREGRAKIREMFCYKLDGKSCERVVSVIRNQIA